MQLQPDGPRLLRKLLLIKRMSRRQLAAHVGIHSSMIDHLIAGRKNSVRPEVAVALATALEVGVDDLFVARVSTDPRRTDNRGVA